MEKLKELWKKLDLKVALIGGVVVISTSLGTCHLMDSPTEEPAAEEAPEAPAPEVPAEEATPPEPAEEADA
mgnify:CR=1 FL=1|jgi:hypothetical protein